MGTIKQVESGWKAFACVKRNRKSKTFSTKAQAKAWIVEIEKAMREANGPAVVGSFRELADDWSKGRAMSRSEAARVGQLVKLWGHLPAKKLDTRSIQAFVDAAAKGPTPVTSRALRASSILRLMHTLGSICSHGRRNGWITESPMAMLSLPKDDPPRERVPTDDEIDLIISNAGYVPGETPHTDTAMVAAAFVLCCQTGMRGGEALRIQRSWINGRTITLPAAAVKTRRGRVVALSKDALATLSDILSAGREPEIVGVTDDSRDALFRKLRDRLLLGDVTDESGRVIKQGLHFHDSRAYFCTMAAKKMDVLSLSKQTGHSDLRMLQRYYRPDAEAMADMLDKE